MKKRFTEAYYLWRSKFGGMSDGVLVDAVFPELDHLRAGEGSSFAFEMIEAVTVERAGCRVEGQETVSPRPVSGLLDGCEDDLDGRCIRG